jgi:hypothetical protein
MHKTNRVTLQRPTKNSKSRWKTRRESGVLVTSTALDTKTRPPKEPSRIHRKKRNHHEMSTKMNEQNSTKSKPREREDGSTLKPKRFRTRTEEGRRAYEINRLLEHGVQIGRLLVHGSSLRARGLISLSALLLSGKRGRARSPDSSHRSRAAAVWGRHTAIYQRKRQKMVERKF